MGVGLGRGQVGPCSLRPCNMLRHMRTHYYSSQWPPRVLVFITGEACICHGRGIGNTMESHSIFAWDTNDCMALATMTGYYDVMIAGGEVLSFFCFPTIELELRVLINDVEGS